MKKLIIASVITAGIFAIIPSCTHDPILPSQQVTFSGDVGNILKSNCAFSGCHDTTGAGPQLRIDRYEDLQTLGRVVAGKPHESEIFKRITTYQNIEGHMPKEPYLPLTDDNIRKIYIWIAQGAQNN